MLTSGLLVVFGALLVAVHAEEPRIGFNLPYLGLNSGRIVGGEDSERGEFPHQVSLQYGQSETTRHFCGGSLIDRQWVLTAAHCPLALPSYGKFVVKVGKHNIRNKEDTEQEIKVVRRIIHEKYAGGVGPYDIALLKLESPVDLSRAVKTINLPKIGGQPWEKSVLSGWGSTTPYGGAAPAILQKVVLPIVDLETCRKSIESVTGSKSPVHKTNVCTGSMNGKVSACSGDSGGPLIRFNSTGDHEVIGIVSWGIIPCAIKGSASVYTDVAQFLDWIKENMN